MSMIMNQQVFGAYLIVKILSKNRNDLDKFECVPSTWVKVKDNYDDTVVFGYPKEDRLVTRLRIIEYQPLDSTWPTTFGEVVLDTDSQEDAFQNLKRKNEHESIIDQPKDSGKQDNKEVKSTTSKTMELKATNQTMKKRGRPSKSEQSDQESIKQSKENEDQTKKKRARPRKSEQSDQESITQSKENEDQTKKKRGHPRKREKSDQESIPQSKKNEGQSRQKRGHPRKQKQSDQESIQSKESEDELKKKLELQISEAHELIRTYESDFYDEGFVFSSTPKSSHNLQEADTTQILPNETDNALEETPIYNSVSKIIKRRKSTRETRNLSEGHSGIPEEDFDKSDQLLPNETDNALEETPVSNTACKVIKRRKSTRQTRDLTERCLGISDEVFVRSDQILPNDNALEETPVNNIACKVLKRRKSTRLTRNLLEGHLGHSDEHFDKYEQILPNDNAFEETPINNTACKVTKRRKSTRQTRNLSEGYLGILNEDLDKSYQILPNQNDNALEETPVNDTACKVIKRRKSTLQTRNLSEGCLGILNEDFDKPDQRLPNETSNALEKTQVNTSACKIMTRRKSTRQTRNLSEGYLEFSDEDFDRSDDSDYTPEIVHPPLPDLPKPPGTVPTRDQDILNMNLLNDQVYSECYNFYVEFNESYQKSMSILENAEGYLQNIISSHKDEVAAKAKPPSPSPSYQEPDAICPTTFSYPQPLLQERSTSSISEEDARWTVRYPEPGPGLIELMPNTGVYVSEKGLNNCKSTISETTKFTRALLAEVFTDEALRNCSFTGVSRRKIRKNPKKTPKPGLDPKTREIFLDYVLKYSLNMGWEKANTEIIMSCIKNRLQWLHTANCMS